MDKLKSCPFCGDKYIQAYMSNNYYDIGYRIGCNTLGCICLHTKSNVYKTKEEAIEAWNRRAGEQE